MVERAQSLYDTALAQIAAKKYRTATHTLRECVEAYGELGMTDTEAFGKTILALAKICVLQRQWEQALEMLDRARVFLAGSGLKESTSYYVMLRETGLCHQELKQWKEACEWLWEAYYFRAKQYPYLSMNSERDLYHLGKAYLGAQRWDDALRCFEDCLQLHAKIYNQERPATLELKELARQARQTKESFVHWFSALTCKGGCGKQAVQFCSTECITKVWLATRRDMVRCDYCKEYVGLATVCPGGRIYCRSEVCKDKHKSDH